MRGYSVYERKGRPRWYVCYLAAETGDWKDAVTPFRIDDPQGKVKALRLAEQRASEFKRTSTGRRKEAWSAWVADWLKSRYIGERKTFMRYSAAWDKLRLFLAERSVQAPSAITYEHAATYVPWRMQMDRNRGTKISRNTAVYETKIMGMVMREAVKRGFALTNPFDRLGLKRDRPKEKPELSDEDIYKIRALVREKEKALPIGERWMSTSFEIALHQGCRLMETGLPMADVDIERMTIKFRAKGRNGQPHIFTTALHPGLVPLIRELKASQALNTCVMPKMAGKLWWQFRVRNGLGHTTFHSTRVTVITRLARQGVPMSQAMRFVGHSSRAVHQVYQKLAAEDLSACTAALVFPGQPKKGTRRAPSHTPAPVKASPHVP